MRLTDEVSAKRPEGGQRNDRSAAPRDVQRHSGSRNAPQVESAMASAFAKLKR